MKYNKHGTLYTLVADGFYVNKKTKYLKTKHAVFFLKKSDILNYGVNLENPRLHLSSKHILIFNFFLHLCEIILFYLLRFKKYNEF